ncbi:MAG TPA: phosphoglycolate phosphatase, partial [Burkholderiaceae bacterium]|nr:phosphoglycolate phosphatase [Burkholderiaceae bacterium]
MLQAAIIDLDGTLVDTLGDFAEALNRTLTDLKLPPIGRAQIERMIGKGSENLLLSAMAHLGEPDPTGRLPEAWSAYQRHYLDVNGRFSQVFDGAVEGLQALRDAGLPLACLTNKPLAFAQTLLRDKGLAGFFGHVFGGDSFERKKPDPLPLLKTCEALGTAPAHTLMVGDSQNDGLAARAAGCPVVLVTYGYNHGDPI